MEPVQLWSAVQFTAQNGATEALLADAAESGLHLYEITPQPGGFCARCAAWRYRRLAALARRRRVRLQVQKRHGLFFRIRPLLRRAGLWIGLAVFVPLLLWARGLVWAVEYIDLTPGQQARAAEVLRQTVALQPGAQVSEAQLTAGEYALLQSGEFSWASLNFFGGRLTVEAAAAKPVPEIASGTLHGIRARVGGVVEEVNLKSGTALVAPGQTVEAGQGLIGTARSERDGTLIFEPAAGTVLARFDWQGEWAQPLTVNSEQLTGKTAARFTLFFAGRSWTPPALLGESAYEAEDVRTRHVQPGLWELILPVGITEEIHYERQTQEVTYTENQALEIARLHSLQALHDAYPDAQLIARRESVSLTSGTLYYSVTYTVSADICE